MQDSQKYTITGQAKLVLLKDFLAGRDKKSRVLDVGGTMHDLEFIQSLGFEELKVSNNSEAELEGCGKDGLLFDITKPNNKIKQFDIIIFMDVLEHLVKPDEALVNINAMLTKKGFLILTTPNLASLFNRVFLLLGWSLPNYSAASIKTGNPIIKAKISTSFRDSFPHKSVFTPNQLKELLTLYGFDVIKHQGYDYGSPKASSSGGNYNFSRKLLNNILPASMKEGIFIVCKKERVVSTEALVQKFS